MFSPNGIITLSTDFGLGDAYVAIMKGVILGIASRATMIDYSHGIAPGNIAQAAYVLQSGYRYFPPGTTHVTVVDPGVGSERRAVAIETPLAAFVGPDNGVFSLIVEDMRREGVREMRIVELTDSRYWLPHVSPTFHGRDVFAPVAAHIASGVPVASLGRQLDELVDGALPRPTRVDGAGLRGTIIYVDRFGNCVTNITREHLRRHELGQHVVVQIIDQQLPGLYRTYAECPPGVPICMLGSSEHLELAVANGSASQVLGVDVDDPLIVRRQTI